MTMRWPWSPPPPEPPEREPDPAIREARAERERTARWLARIMPLLPQIDPNDLLEPATRPERAGHAGD